MIYLIYGSDKDKTRKKSDELVASLKKKKPDAEFFRLNDESWDAAVAEGYAKSQGLFEQKYIVLIENILANKEVKKEIKEQLLDLMKAMGESQNIFIFREGEPDKKTLTAIEKYSTKSEEHSFTKEEKAAKKKMPFNVFSLGDALGRRDKKMLWVLYQEAKDNGLEDEQIAGTLFWQIKNMLLTGGKGSTSGAKTAEEAGLHPFVFSKTRTAAQNYTDEELKAISSKLIHLYHDARRSIHDLDNALERFTLEL